MQVVQDRARVALAERIGAGMGRTVPRWWRFAKRATDVIAGTAALVATAPLIAASAAAIVVTTRGLPFYAQERVGMNGRYFRMFKLRTMIEGAHDMREDLLHLNEADGPVFKIKDDPRVHPVGAFLRRTSIDELPNLINVVLGQMSLVGPRPALPSEVEHYSAAALRRLSVPQGITGLWQISGRSNVSFDEWMQLDSRYIDTWSPLSDLAILAKTIPAVLQRNGAH